MATAAVGAAAAANNPYRAVYGQLRTAPVAQLRQALQQQVAAHLQQLHQMHPCPPGVSPEQRQMHQQQLTFLQQQQMREQLTGPAEGTALFEAAQRASDAEALELSVILTDEFKAALPTATDRMGQTCLFYAAREGHAQLCRFLLSRGVDVNHRDSVGQTCIFYAAREGRASCLGVLLQGGGDPNILDVNKQTCLFYACRDNRLEAVRLLLQHGADASVKDTLRRTAWNFAKNNGHLAVCALLRQGASAAGGGGADLGAPHSPALFAAGGLQSSASRLAGEGGTASLNSSSSLGSACGGGVAAAGGEDAASTHPLHAQQQRPRRKYRLQFQPLPTEAPQLWIDCPTEKLEEFARLFPTLDVWPPSVVAAAATSPNAAEYSAANCLSRCEALMQPWQAAASQLLAALSKYEGAHIFDRPVDPKTAPGYYDVVTTPMSLSCVKAKLKKQVYRHPHAFLSDVQLIFDNCALYNQPGTWVHSIGKNMEKFFLNQVMVMRFRDYGLTFNKILSNLQQTAATNEQLRAKTEGGAAAPSAHPASAASAPSPQTAEEKTSAPPPSAPSSVSPIPAAATPSDAPSAPAENAPPEAAQTAQQPPAPQQPQQQQPPQQPQSVAPPQPQDSASGSSAETTSALAPPDAAAEGEAVAEKKDAASPQVPEEKGAEETTAAPTTDMAVDS